MKKNIAILFALIISNIAYSQVGFNTPDPKATLDVEAKISTGNSSTPEGIITPRVDRLRAQSMTGIEKSTLIFVNNISTGSQAGIAVNIDEEGFYYFNGTVWAKISMTGQGNIAIAKVVAAGYSNSTINMAGSSGYNKFTFNATLNDGNWDSSTNSYTVPKAGFYQFSLQGLVQVSTNSNSFLWVVVYDSSNFILNTSNNLQAGITWNSGGLVSMYLPQGTVISFGGIPCTGCTSVYAAYDRTFTITYLGS